MGPYHRGGTFELICGKLVFNKTTFANYEALFRYPMNEDLLVEIMIMQGLKYVKG